MKKAIAFMVDMSIPTEEDKLIAHALGVSLKDDYKWTTANPMQFDTRLVRGLSFNLQREDTEDDYQS